MFDLFKKIGLPATIAALISIIITLIPFLFKLDERYAKASELEEAIQKVDTKVTALNVEVGKLTGITQVLVAVVGQAEEDEPAPVIVGAAPQSEPVVVASAPKSAKPLVVEKVEIPQVPTSAGEQKEALDQAKRALEASQRNIQQIQKY